MRSLDFVQNIKEKEFDNRYLSLNEIRQIYPNQWVLLADTQVEGITILGGRVILNDSDKRQLALLGRELVKENNHVRHFYTGVRPNNQKHIGIIVPQKTT